MEEKNSDSIFDIDGDGIQVKPQPYPCICLSKIEALFP